MRARLLKPQLYQDGADGPILLGGRCACGYFFFPFQHYGCERCGKSGAHLQPINLRAKGNLIASALVHMHGDKRRHAPFVVGTIALEGGPVIRTLLSSAPQQRQSLMVGEFVLVTADDGTERLDLRFKPAA